MLAVKLTIAPPAKCWSCQQPYQGKAGETNRFQVEDTWDMEHIILSRKSRWKCPSCGRWSRWREAAREYVQARDLPEWMVS